MPTYQNVAIIGVGLIGGSIGLALRERGLARQVVGVGRRQASLDKALDCEAIDRATTNLEEGVQQAELVIVCTPVAAIAGDVCRALQASEALVTDAGSTKAAICSAVETQASGVRASDSGAAGSLPAAFLPPASLPPGASRFVGSHPLAGDHRQGPENARSDLFSEKTVVITPTATSADETTTRVQKFWQALGAQVVQMSPAEHDQALAATSHLPHLVASALAATTPEQWLPLAATGWCDTTRVAAGDPGLWTQIFAQNKTDLLSALDRLIVHFGQMREALAAEDWHQTQEHLDQAKRIRDALGN